VVSSVTGEQGLEAGEAGLGEVAAESAAVVGASSPDEHEVSGDWPGGEGSVAAGPPRATPPGRMACCPWVAVMSRDEPPGRRLAPSGGRAYQHANRDVLFAGMMA
jgi:hypothetical protein